MTPATVTVRNIQPDEQSSTAIPGGAGVDEGTGVALGGGVKETVGWGLLVVLVFVIAGSAGSVPVMETDRNRTRAWAEVELSPKKRKFGVS